MKRTLIDELKAKAIPSQRRAIRELERIGFTFCAHFGTENALQKLQGIQRAIRTRQLYAHLKTEFGILTSEGGPR